MRISEAKQGEVVCYGNYYFKVLIAATNGIVVENVNTNTVQVLDPETEVTPAEEVIQEVLNQFVDAVNERLSGLVDCDEDEYDEDEEEEYDEDDAEDELYQECVEDVVEDLKDNGLVEAGEDAEAILLDTEARYHAAIVDAIAKLRMFSYTEDPKLLDDVEETLFTLF